MSRELRDEAMKDLARVDERMQDAIALAGQDGPTGEHVLIQAIGAIGREVSLIAEIVRADLAGRLDE